VPAQASIFVAISRKFSDRNHADYNGNARKGDPSTLLSPLLRMRPPKTFL
jgi:hypothetical protein